MNRFKFGRLSRWLISGGTSLVLVAVIASATTTLSAKAASSGKSSGGGSTGSQLYAIHCGRCHMERYPTERTDAQWQTIIMHMRVHGNLPGADAQKILDYLKGSN